jgi:hypothetical protein
MISPCDADTYEGRSQNLRHPLVTGISISMRQLHADAFNFYHNLAIK